MTMDFVLSNLLNDPSVWVSFVSLLLLEIVLGVDNMVFISIAAARLPAGQQASARFLGVLGAFGLRIAMLFSLGWVFVQTTPAVTLFETEFSWRDLIFLAGGIFLIWRASTEIFNEVEGHVPSARTVAATFFAVIMKIMMLDILFSLESVVTAVGITEQIEVIGAAVLLAAFVTLLLAEPIARFVDDHPSTKLLALALLIMVGMALMADGLHFHVERRYVQLVVFLVLVIGIVKLMRTRRKHRRLSRDAA
jgi:predicted tellurium resistance membrane protein TerC